MLYCGECRKREAKVINTQDMRDNIKPGDENYDYYAAGILRCNVCAGARKRWKWSQAPNFLPMDTFPDIVEGAKRNKAALDAARVKQAAEQAAQNRLKQIEWAAREWKNETITYEVSEKKLDSWDKNAGYVVAPEGVENPSRSASVEAYTAREGSVTYPFQVRTSVSSHLTANEARAVADALIRTANLVDAKNAEIRPQE